MAVPAELDAGLLQSEMHGVWHPPRRRQRHVGLEPVATLEVQQVGAPCLLDMRDVCHDADIDPVRTHCFGRAVADLAVKFAQDLLAAIDEADLRTEPGEDRGKLNTDIARADDSDAARQAFQLEAFVRADQMLLAGY